MSDSSGMEEGGVDGANGVDGTNGADGDDGDDVVAVDLPVAPTAVFGAVVWGAVDWVAARRARRRARLRARRSMVGRRNSKATISAGGSCASVPLSW